MNFHALLDAIQPSKAVEISEFKVLIEQIKQNYALAIVDESAKEHMKYWGKWINFITEISVSVIMIIITVWCATCLELIKIITMLNEYGRISPQKASWSMCLCFEKKWVLPPILVQ